MINRLWTWYDSKPDYIRFYLMFLILSPPFFLMFFTKTNLFGMFLFGVIGLWRIIYITKGDLKCRNHLSQ